VYFQDSHLSCVYSTHGFQIFENMADFYRKISKKVLTWVAKKKKKIKLEMLRLKGVKTSNSNDITCHIRATYDFPL